MRLEVPRIRAWLPQRKYPLDIVSGMLARKLPLPEFVWDGILRHLGERPDIDRPCFSDDVLGLLIALIGQGPEEIRPKVLNRAVQLLAEKKRHQDWSEDAELALREAILACMKHGRTGISRERTEQFLNDCDFRCQNDALKVAAAWGQGAYSYLLSHIGYPAVKALTYIVWRQLTTDPNGHRRPVGEVRTYAHAMGGYAEKLLLFYHLVGTHGTKLRMEDYLDARTTPTDLDAAVRREFGRGRVG